MPSYCRALSRGILAMSNDLLTLTATQAARLIHTGQLSPLDLMEAYLDHIGSREPTVRAFVHFDPDQVRAVHRVGPARPAARHPHRGQGRAGHRRHAQPVRIADLGQTGSRGPTPPPSHGRAVPAPSSYGKTVTTEFATRKPGPTMNPANPAHTPGGSSSGSAAGVGAGLFPLAYGTQTAGSVIRPGRLLRRRRLQAQLRPDQPHRHEDHVGQPGHGWRYRSHGR